MPGVHRRGFDLHGSVILNIIGRVAMFANRRLGILAILYNVAIVSLERV